MVIAVPAQSTPMENVMLFRHDPITLHAGAVEADFERFMSDELMPFFSEHYKGPTRASRADIRGQSLLQATGRAREYLWITSWDGSAESVAGPGFEQARMVKVDATDAILKKLETFGKRGTEHLFAERSSVVLATNT